MLIGVGKDAFVHLHFNLPKLHLLHGCRNTVSHFCCGSIVVFWGNTFTQCKCYPVYGLFREILLKMDLKGVNPSMIGLSEIVLYKVAKNGFQTGS